MAKYFPQITIRLIQKEWFKANGRKLSGLIKGWESNNTPFIRGDVQTDGAEGVAVRVEVESKTEGKVKLNKVENSCCSNPG